MRRKVVLADDEPLIVKGLSKLIPWNDYELDLVAFAYDGKELLDAIAQHQPDIVVSDISMPHFTGIDMIKEMKRLELPVKVIFISAYQEFSYAKDAVAYGAVDYLVKPVNKSELEEVVRKAISLLQEEDEEGKRRHKLEQLERKAGEDEIGSWLKQLTEGTLSLHSDAYQTLQEMMAGELRTVSVIQVDPKGNDHERWPAQTRKLVEFAIHNVVQESLLAYGAGYLFLKNGNYTVVLDHDEPDMPKLLADTLIRNIDGFLKLKVSIGIGGSKRELTQLKTSCEEAEYALGMTYFYGMNRTLSYRLPEQRKDSEHKLFALQLDMIKAMIGQQWETVLAKLEELMTVIESATIGNRKLAVSAAFSSILHIAQEVKKSGANLPEGGFDIQHLQSRLEQYDSYVELSEGVREILQELYDRIDDRSGSKEKTLIAKLVAYIDEHYREDISLESVAAIAFMNPYYFSSFFKKHMKQNFKQYVTDLRMKHAIKLLASTDMMVYEIAEEVGYKNARHFSDMLPDSSGRKTAGCGWRQAASGRL
ncbi:response regulator [Paenibacillus sp. HB172176]|uniref:response regulator n=1 Tax=Paenibacillus sp. HB172176 TaxID=2493690 RepID=UPI00143C1D5A|nr:response regulator [Paenibacillus sp. HB172176]